MKGISYEVDENICHLKLSELIESETRFNPASRGKIVRLPDRDVADVINIKFKWT